ncbi:MAG: MBOAT family protein [Victivallaceae bacterium]|nr:MBOAT family protein [Victivallaceae bacterium]
MRWGYLSICSFVFYGWWDWRFLFLIMISGGMNYVAGEVIDRFRGRRAASLSMWLAVAGNLGLLGVFKYLDFSIANINALIDWFSPGSRLPMQNLILPVGISFYTFQALSYTLDIYRGMKPARNFLHFMAFLSMFPQLVAGPVLRASDMLPQLEECHSPTPDEQWDGFRQIVLGYFKKVVIADNLAPFVDMAFSNSGNFSGTILWWGVMLSFALQIYGDFSGYSDIACGIARWMGYKFINNFNHPYIACSLREFWERWHISLSTFFRDYVYIPLGGNRKGKLRSHVNMWCAMLLSGFWHGASWNFVIWGALHAFFLSLERVTRWPLLLGRVPRLGRLLCVAVSLVLVTTAWVFFRAEDLPQAIHVLKAMFVWHAGGFPVASQIRAVACLGVGTLIEVGAYLGIYALPVWKSRSWRWIQLPLLAAVLLSCVFLRGSGHAFIYFQF